MGGGGGRDGAKEGCGRMTVAKNTLSAVVQGSMDRARRAVLLLVGVRNKKNG